MKRNLAVAFLGLCFVVGGFVRAEAQGGSSGAKIAFIDLQRTLTETKVGRDAKKRLENNLKKKQRQLDKEQKALKGAAEQLAKQQMMLKPEVRAKRERDLQQKYVALQETYMKLQQDLVAQEAKLVKEIFKKAAPVIKKVAMQKGYTYVLDKTMVLWAESRFDITAEVSKRIK